MLDDTCQKNIEKLFNQFVSDCIDAGFAPCGLIGVPISSSGISVLFRRSAPPDMIKKIDKAMKEFVEESNNKYDGETIQ